MCGICGFTGATETDAPTLKAMCDIMAHRGPDGEGQYLADGVALGHRRLSCLANLLIGVTNTFSGASLGGRPGGP